MLCLGQQMAKGFPLAAAYSGMSMNGNVTAVLSRSRIYRGYAKAFTEVTGLPLFLCPLDAALLSRIKLGQSSWNCASLGQPHCTCKCCAKAFARMSKAPPSEPGVIHFAQCPCGTLVPVRSGTDLIALLKLGPAGDESTPPRQGRKARKPQPPAPPCGSARVDKPSRSEYQPFSPTRYRAAVKLVGMFAQQLSGLCNQLVVQEQTGEPEAIRRAKDYIARRHNEDVSSSQVAKELHLSRFYFCTLFKKRTGLTFTEYLTRVRIERVKELLANPNLRISEIAFQTGFQSLTHFNRVFLKLTGESPTEYRSRFRAI